MSKQRPSAGTTGLESVSEGGGDKVATYWRQRVFRNSYTRHGRSIRLESWSVKIQHQGKRRTFSLSAKTRTAAATEAKAIHDTIITDGWEIALRSYSPGAGSVEDYPRTDIRYWRERLLHRPYCFPPLGKVATDLAVRIDHFGTGYFFPLGTPDPEVAAERAHAVYWKVVKQGWEPACQSFPRELVIGFEWCANPLMWTYTTVCSLVARNGGWEPDLSPAKPGSRPVLVVEPDDGIRRALLWCVNQHPGFCGLPCNSTESVPETLRGQTPCILLLNRDLSNPLPSQLQGKPGSIGQSVLVLRYSVCADGDELFASTAGGCTGYFFTRVQPSRLLGPILEASARPDLSTKDLIPRIRFYFKDLLRPRTDEAVSGLNKLTRRERDVLLLLSKGCVDKEIAQTLGISAWTVHGHIKSIFERLQVRTRTEAVVRYLDK